MGLKGIKWGQIWSNWTKPDQAGPNRAKPLPKRVKQGQTRLNRLKWGCYCGRQGNLG